MYHSFPERYNLLHKPMNTNMHINTNMLINTTLYILLLKRYRGGKRKYEKMETYRFSVHWQHVVMERILIEQTTFNCSIKSIITLRHYQNLVFVAMAVQSKYAA